MTGELLLSGDARSTAAIFLLTIVAVEYGGTFVLRVVRGRFGATEFQKAFFRAWQGGAGSVPRSSRTHGERRAASLNTVGFERAR